MQLAAVDGIGAGFTNQAGGHILHTPLFTHITHTHHACRSGTGKLIGCAINGGGSIGGGTRSLGSGCGNRSRTATQIHRVGRRGCHIITQYKAIIGGHGIIVTDCVTALAANRIRVTNRARAFTGYDVAGTDSNAVFACRR